MLGTAWTVVPAEAAASDVLALIGRLQPQNAVAAAVLTGLVIFSTTTALLHLRERRRWTDREAALAAEVANLRDVQDRADLLLGSERQLLVTWNGRDAEPRCEGDPTIAGEAATFRRALAFGAWLGPADAAALEASLESLKATGEPFRLTARTVRQGYVDAEGRTIGGRAVLRLRDVSGERGELLRTGDELATLRSGWSALTALLDALPQPVWSRDRDGRIAWANRAYLAAVEAKSLDDARARSLELLDRNAREELARKRLAGEPFSARLPAIVAGGRRVLEVVESPTAFGSAGVALDISELAAVRSDVERQIATHVRTLDQLPTAVAMFDDKQRLVFHNAAYRQLFGLDAAFLAARPSESEILERLRAARKLPEQADFRTWKASVLEAYRAVEPHETWWHLPDRRTLRVVANPNPSGGLIYLFDDLSERVRLESQYNGLIRTQRETLDTLREGVAVFGPDGRLKLFNRAFAELWRLPPDLLVGEPHVDAVIRQCRVIAAADQPWGDIRAAIAGLPDTRISLTCRLERSDGSALDCAAQPLPDGATLLTFVDVTASVNVERALTDKNDALERASRLRDDFVHHVSYELRSPLTNVIGFTQLLGDETVGPLNPRQREYADHILRSSGALLAIVNDILDLASIDTGALELNPEVVDIRDTIAAAVTGIEDRVAEASLTLEIDAPAGIGTFIADGKRVRQILFNLLSNAVSFSSPGQIVTVRARKSDQEVVLEVCDQGRGIPPEVVTRVFERFESHALGTRHRGVGLGLSIVRSFVELHGGSVELDSEPGRGTIVRCVFPARGAPQRIAAE
jgi:signal transduction histidine kinase